MLIVHTSDWHAGRLWKGIDRLDELQAVLADLGDFIERERVELVLMSGDVFDSRGPSAAAERAVFGFFKRLGKAGAKTVVIAGNHDDPIRLEAWGSLAELVDVTTVARPSRPDRGGVIECSGRSGHQAVIAAVPFAKPSDLVSAATMAAVDEGAGYKRYAEGLIQIVGALCARYRADAVNLMLAHTHLDGAEITTKSSRSAPTGCRSCSISRSARRAIGSPATRDVGAPATPSWRRSIPPVVPGRARTACARSTMRSSACSACPTTPSPRR